MSEKSLPVTICPLSEKSFPVTICPLARKSLSEKEFYHKGISGLFKRKDVKEAILRLKKEREEFEAMVVGLVWGLAYNTNFDVKNFNIEIDKLRKKYSITKIVGEELSK